MFRRWRCTRPIRLRETDASIDLVQHGTGRDAAECDRAALRFAGSLGGSSSVASVRSSAFSDWSFKHLGLTVRLAKAANGEPHSASFFRAVGIVAESAAGPIIGEDCDGLRVSATEGVGRDRDPSAFGYPSGGAAVAIAAGNQGEPMHLGPAAEATRPGVSGRSGAQTIDLRTRLGWAVRP